MIVYSMCFILFLAAVFLYVKFRGRVPILMYHRIADVPGDRNALSPEKFQAQLAYLASGGFTTVTMEMVCAHYLLGKPLPRKPVLLTFDDGYEDNYTTALPLLKAHKMTGAVFAIANWVGRENRWENFNKQPTKTMDWRQLSTWQSSGMEIASHTMDHPFLSKCADDVLTAELENSKRILSEKLGAEVAYLCYPYGDFNEKVARAARKAAYKAAFAIFDGAPLWRIDPYALPRIPVPARQPMWEFKLKVSKIHVLFIALRKLERAVKALLRK